MKSIYFFLISFFFIACNPSSQDETDKIVPVKQEIVEAILEDIENNPDFVKMMAKRYDSGRYERVVGEGVIKLNIQQISGTKCRFVFDTYNTSCWAKIAGELYIDQDGKASYTANRCESLDFHFTKDGISVKEFNCNGYHGTKCSFDGFYTKHKEVEENINPTRLLRELEKGEKKFDFYASFTEPFWTLYFVGNQIIFNHMEDEPDIFTADQPFDPTKDKQIIHFLKGDEEWAVFIEKGEGSDGMSEINYPYNVIINKTFYGGGGMQFCKEEY